MITLLATICLVLGVILLILSTFGVLTGLTPYGTHGAVILIVIGVILYILAFFLGGHAVSYNP